MSKITEFQKAIDEKKINITLDITQEEVLKMCDSSYVNGSIATLEMLENYAHTAEPDIDELLIVISLWKTKMKEKKE